MAEASIQEDIPIEILRNEPDFDARLYNVALDAVIEDVMITAGVPFPPEGPLGVAGLLATSFEITVSDDEARQDYNVTRLYRMLMEQKAAQTT
jgi:hypothetical protein